LTERIELGRISRPHGLQGEVEVRLHWAASTSLLDAREVVLSGPKGERRCSVERARPTPKGVLLSLGGVSDRTTAEGLQGWLVSIERSALPPLEEGEYYLCDVVGAEVLGPGGLRLGRVVDLRIYPTLDALLIERADGGFAEQPLVEPWLERVDVAARQVVLSSTDGWLEVSREEVEKDRRAREREEQA
jgi:16S rRNA processing protein RimM